MRHSRLSQQPPPQVHPECVDCEARPKLQFLHAVGHCRKRFTALARACSASAPQLAVSGQKKRPDKLATLKVTHGAVASALLTLRGVESQS